MNYRSTGFRNYMLVTGSFKAAFDGMVIKIYNGAVPADADADIGAATLVNTYSLNDTGAGLSLDSTPSGGVLSKNPSEVWSGTPVATATGTFFRACFPADAGGASTTERRIQGTCGSALADMVLTNPNFTSGVLRTLNNAQFGMPAS